MLILRRGVNKPGGGGSGKRHRTPLPSWPMMPIIILENLLKFLFAAQIRSQIRSQMDYGDHNEDSPAHLAMSIVRGNILKPCFSKNNSHDHSQIPEVGIQDILGHFAAIPVGNFRLSLTKIPTTETLLVIDLCFVVETLKSIREAGWYGYELQQGRDHDFCCFC